MRTAMEAGLLLTSENIAPFSFFTPTKIVFGEGTAYSVGDFLSDLGVSKPILITDKNLTKVGLLQPILESCQSAGVPVVATFDDVPSDSELLVCRNAIELAKKNNCDGVIAVGGGSVMDTAKIVNIALSLGGDILDYEGMNTFNENLKPLVAIPTTAGTGSEVSAVAMVKNQDTKILFASRFLFPNVAVLDPALIVSLPPRLTAATGMDALTHCLESLAAVSANYVSDGTALEAVRLLFKYLPVATKNGADMEARSATLIASCMAGLAFTNAGVGVIHALAHTIGAKYGTHHGITNAVLLPHGLLFNINESAPKLARVWRYVRMSLGANQAEISFNDEEAVHLLIEDVRALMIECGLPTQLRDLMLPELDEEDFVEIAQIAMTDAAMMFNPREASVEDLVQLLKGAY
ncbi:MAG: iron-containing alcohol dehydrogenase [Candidatus Obscuribacterales bacterium]